jgi:hypothetical protein
MAESVTRNMCARCQQEDITDTLVHLRWHQPTHGTTWIAAHALCAMCAEDVFWFVVHKTLRRPELLKRETRRDMEGKKR